MVIPQRNAPNCIYCGTDPATEDDHVPAKGFFPKPRPEDLITVPSCWKCNREAGKDEEYFLATLMFSDAGITSAGVRLWKEKLRRMYQKNLGLKGKISSLLAYKRVYTPYGLYLGRRRTLGFEITRLEAVVNKVIRGLYFFEYGERMETNTEVESLFLSTAARFEAADKRSVELAPGSRAWPGVFEWRFGRVEENPQGSIWLTRFWGCACFWTITSPLDDAEEARGLSCSV